MYACKVVEPKGFVRDLHGIHVSMGDPAIKEAIIYYNSKAVTTPDLYSIY
jgi:hypothetical protein